MTSSWNVILLRLVLRNHCTLVFCMAFKNRVYVYARALRGYQALQVTMLLVVNYLLVKACLCSNDKIRR